MEEASHTEEFLSTSEVSSCSIAPLPISNGHSLNIPADVEDDDSERAGVFDYMPQESLLKTESTSGCTRSSYSSDIDEPIARNWAFMTSNVSNSNVNYMNGKELSTFHSSTRQNHSCTGEAANSIDIPDVPSNPDDSLEEIVVQTEVVPQRASYERFNADSRAQRYRPANNAAPVYITNIQRSGDQNNGFVVNYGDERDIVYRKSQQNSSASAGDRYIDAPGDTDSENSANTQSLVATADQHSPTSVISQDASPVPRQFSSNILYLNEFPPMFTRSTGLVSSSDVSVDDVSSSRYYGSNGGGPRSSDTIRRLQRKLQKRNQPGVGTNLSVTSVPVSRSEDVAEYKGNQTVDELIAYINNLKMAESRRSASGGVASSRKKKKVPTATLR